jgi:hypothetical protein
MKYKFAMSNQDQGARLLLALLLALLEACDASGRGISI